MINNGETVATFKPARKIRTRTRKPKYLSLRLKLSPEKSQDSGQKPHRLNLFPLHPEEKDMHDENVACLLASQAGATLTGLLEDGGEVAYSEDGSLSQSLTYVYEGHDSLVRTALRSKERDCSEEEKWVSYSEVVEKKEEEVNSCPADRKLYKDRAARGTLLLKLDYQVVMNAWSDKGPLYVQADCGQIVPDVNDDFTAEDDITVRLWRVPDKEVGEGDGWKMTAQREASVLRYKEKRQSRLFSKRIRYQVRKLNAEKRPRMKVQLIIY